VHFLHNIALMALSLPFNHEFQIRLAISWDLQIEVSGFFFPHQGKPNRSRPTRPAFSGFTPIASTTGRPAIFAGDALVC